MARERVPVATQRIVWVRAGGRCQRCNSDDKRLAVHHRLAVAAGGGNEPENLELLCRPCHAEADCANGLGPENRGGRPRKWADRKRMHVYGDDREMSLIAALAKRCGLQRSAAVIRAVEEAAAREGIG